MVCAYTKEEVSTFPCDSIPTTCWISCLQSGPDPRAVAWQECRGIHSFLPCNSEARHCISSLLTWPFGFAVGQISHQLQRWLEKWDLICYLCHLAGTLSSLLCYDFSEGRGESIYVVKKKPSSSVFAQRTKRYSLILRGTLSAPK